MSGANPGMHATSSPPRVCAASPLNPGYFSSGISGVAWDEPGFDPGEFRERAKETVPPPGFASLNPGYFNSGIRVSTPRPAK